MNGRANLLAGAPADRYLQWALPQLPDLSSSDSETAAVALSSLQEFLGSGEAVATEPYVPSILQACRELLEGDSTSLNLLGPLLGILTTLASRFSQVFQHHFVDIMDLLLGWALMPDLPEADRCLITESFLQFQMFWAGNLKSSLSLLLKFLGDMEVLISDIIAGTSDQMQHLIALTSCFAAVLQAVYYGVVQLNIVMETVGPFKDMLPRLLVCWATVNQKFCTHKWILEASKCLSLIAHLLGHDFAQFYHTALRFLIQSLGLASATSQKQPISKTAPAVHRSMLAPNQMQALLNLNIELIECQGPSFLAGSVFELLSSGSPFSHLRMHPSSLVTGVVSATYLLLVCHEADHVAHQAYECLKQEMELLKLRLEHLCCGERPYKTLSLRDSTHYDGLVSLSETEITRVAKFDLVVLQGSASHGSAETQECKVLKVKDLRKFIFAKVNPFADPMQYYPALQLAIVQTLRRLCVFQILGDLAGAWNVCRSDGEIKAKLEQDVRMLDAVVENLCDCLTSCGPHIARALCFGSTLLVKLEALEWLGSLCSILITTKDVYYNTSVSVGHHQFFANLYLDEDLFCSLLNGASDKEGQMRSRVAVVLLLLLEAGLIESSRMLAVVRVSLEQLSDPEPTIQKEYRRVLAVVAPAALFTFSWAQNASDLSSGIVRRLHWKQVFATVQFSQHLRPQQLVCILNYIAQRGQVLPSGWLQRLVHNFPGNLRAASVEKNSKQESAAAESGFGVVADLDLESLERSCVSSDLASAWWSIHEAARHCITVRLRTHLGGPTQTFAALERMLLDVAQADNGQRESAPPAAVSASSAHLQLLPMRLLLEFVQALKKNIYNAYEGSAVLPTPTLPSIHFFRANRKVCEEWFARISEALMNASWALQCFSGTYHYAVLRLQDLRAASTSALREVAWPQTSSDMPLPLRTKVQQDVLRTLHQGALALCRNHEADMLVGLQAWASSVFGSILADDGLSCQKGPLAWMNGLALQAQGHYEKASLYFTELLQSEDTLGVLGADGVQFVVARIIECYVAVADWDSIDHWLQELHALRAKHAGKAYAGALTTAGNDMNAIHALARFDAGDPQGAWAYLDLTPQSSCDLTTDPRQALQRSEQMLLQAMLRTDRNVDGNTLKEVGTAKAMIQEALLVSGLDYFSVAVPFSVQLHCIEVFESNCVKVECKEGAGSYGSILGPASAVQQVLVAHSLNTLPQDCLPWLKVLRVYRTVLKDSPLSLQLRRQLVRCARKGFNFKLAGNLLKEALHAESHGSHPKVPKGTFEEILEGLEYERILLLNAEGKQEDAVLELWNLVRNLLPSLPSCKMGSRHSVKAKACLKLSTLLKQAGSFSGLRVFQRSLEVAMSGEENTTATNFRYSAVDNIDIIRGTALKAAVHVCPEMAKAWFAYALWCYESAATFLSGDVMRKDDSSLYSRVLEVELPMSASGFSEAEVGRIYTSVIDAVTSDRALQAMEKSEDTRLQLRNELAKSCEGIVQRIIYVMLMAAGVGANEDFNGESPACHLSAQLQLELQVLNLSPSISGKVVNILIEVWWALRRRRVSLYGHAARGFLKYLSLTQNSYPEMAQINKPGTGEEMREKHNLVLSASLYVLQMLFNHGLELEDIIQDGLKSVPPRPWQEITAQLFARLSSHPESSVRKQLGRLLMILANLSPWAVIYPTLVDFNACVGDPSEELHRLLGCLANLHPKLVNGVQMFIAELGAITVLWEEQWLSTLQDLHADVSRRIATLKEEVIRVAENSTLTVSEKSRINAAKYSAMMAPIAVALERRLTSTSRVPETVHEAWFQEQYGAQLKAAIHAFKSAPSNPASLGDVWRPFDSIVASLASNQKKSIILLHEMAPKLAILNSSEIPIPGLEKYMPSFSGMPYGPKTQGIVTVAAFDEQVTILATKTRPKKLTMVGSDGQQYTYLLKGREDLRLDARIMQLLKAVNGILVSCHQTRSKNLAVRHYSVTPISGRAGLIQWLDNLSSVYGVYKAWQQRNQTAQLTNSGASNFNASVPRPSDMFYGKIIPALKEKGLRKVISRRDWPQEVKRKVLLELMKETPKQLLYHEIWCASEGYTAFGAKLQKFSGSVAVMSIVGHILGLGDRHLDNILMDFSTGDVVHIDYNVCFEKGLRLKIPEIVPFRLTQTMEAALGVTGVEGVFRANCKTVLEALRRNKKLIRMLLEVFVWDPLVEWMRGDSHDEAAIGGEERKGMELAVSLSLFASRIQEIRVPLQEHHDQLLMVLPTLVTSLQHLKGALDHYEQATAAFLHTQNEWIMASSVEAQLQPFLNEISAALDKAKHAYGIHPRNLPVAKGGGVHVTEKPSQWMEPAADPLRSSLLPEVQGTAPFSNRVEALSSAYKVLSTDAERGWQLLLSQWERTSSKLSSATEKRRLALVEGESAKGTLQAAISVLKDLIVEAASTVSSFNNVVHDHSALTTETGAMLEEVLAITDGADGAHDVHNLAREASTLHRKLMTDLNKLIVMLPPIDSTLVSASNVVGSLQGFLLYNETESHKEIPILQNQGVLKSTHVTISEAMSVLLATVPELINFVKELHGSLMKLARTASLDAGLLHEALEGLGESQEARSQEVGIGAAAGGDAFEGSEIYQHLNELGENIGDSCANEAVDVQDGDDNDDNDEEEEECWISPPNSSLSSQLSSQATTLFQSNFWSPKEYKKVAQNQQSDASDLDQQNVPEIPKPNQFSISKDDRLKATITTTSTSQDILTSQKIGKPDTSQVSHSTNPTAPDITSNLWLASLPGSTGALSAASDQRTEETFPNIRPKLQHHQKNVWDKDIRGSYGDLGTLPRHSRGKNAYAVSVLKRVELKLEGLDIDSKRPLTVTEQVDHLLQQATSVDNLCNMYEGWTPWI